MKSSRSTLNPNAVAYVPLAKREGQELDTESNVIPGKSAISDSNSIADDVKLKAYQVDVAHATPADSHSHDMDSHFLDEESEMDLAYLQMVFPGMSDQSLADVYNVNRGDLEAAIEMLTDLESADDHPDTLNTAESQSQETVSSGECSSAKAVNVAGESSASSGSSGVTVASS